MGMGMGRWWMRSVGRRGRRRGCCERGMDGWMDGCEELSQSRVE